MPNHNPEDDSTYPKIELPEFKSDIPEHLLNSVSPESKYMLEQLSKLNQSASWMVNVLVDVNQQVRKTNGRVIALETWRDRIMSIATSWWGILGALGTLVMAIAAAIEVGKFVGDHWPK